MPMTIDRQLLRTAVIPESVPDAAIERIAYCLEHFDAALPGTDFHACLLTLKTQYEAEVEAAELRARGFVGGP